MNLTADQTQVSNDLIKYIQAKQIVINSPEDLDKAFRAYLLEGSASHFYLQKANDHQKKQFSKRISTELKLN